MTKTAAPRLAIPLGLAHSVRWPLVALLLASTGVGAQELSKAQQQFERGFAFHTAEEDERDLDRAIKWYRAAIKSDPQFFEAYSNAGLVYYELEKYGTAKRYLGKAIELARKRDDIAGGTEAQLLSDMGGCYFQEGNNRDAEKWFRGAIRKDPGLAEAHYNLINLLMKEDRREEVKAALELAKRVAPDIRYGQIEGRLKGKESGEEWNPTWVKVLAALLAISVVVYTVYVATRSRGAGP